MKLYFIDNSSLLSPFLVYKKISKSFKNPKNPQFLFKIFIKHNLNVHKFHSHFNIIILTHSLHYCQVFKRYLCCLHSSLPSSVTPQCLPCLSVSLKTMDSFILLISQCTIYSLFNYIFFDFYDTKFFSSFCSVFISSSLFISCLNI